MKKIFSIGMNGSMLDDQPTGVGVYSYNLFNHLCSLYSESGQTLTVFTPTRKLLHPNLRIIKISGFLRSSKYGKIAAATRFFWNTFLYRFKAGKFDIMLSPTSHGSFLLKNQIITIHDLLSLRYKNISAHQRFYFKYLLPLLISRARVIVAVSESTKRDIIDLCGCPADKVIVVYNGYDPLQYYYNDVKSNAMEKDYGVSDYFLAVGPTYPHKNFEFLLNAYSKLPEAITKEHPLVIAGGMKKYVEDLKKRIIELELEDRVHFLGYVPAQQMGNLYREAFALVFPSLYEGFGFPLLEAMACGCPVMLSNTSSMPEVCGDAAIYFDPTDNNSIQNAFEKIISDKELRKILIDKGLARAREFSWHKTAKSIKAIIDKQFSAS
ncbi:MAG: glycosyltransferase family 4 protein [Chitinophagaceae bacterium]